MARLPRVIAVDVPHHITQRANARRFILHSDSDRLVYLDLLRQYCPLLRTLAFGLLPHLQPRASGRDSRQG